MGKFNLGEKKQKKKPTSKGVYLCSSYALLIFYQTQNLSHITASMEYPNSILDNGSGEGRVHCPRERV